MRGQPQFQTPTTEIYATTADAQTALGAAMPTWIPADGTLIRTKSEAKAGTIVAVADRDRPLPPPAAAPTCR